MDSFARFTTAIFTISRCWNKIASEEMRPFGMRGSYALYLVVLASAEEPPTGTRLAELVQRDKADVSRAIGVLQKKGIIEPYGENRYRAPIRLTEEGYALSKQVQKRAAEAVEVAGKGLTDEMRTAMYLSLDIISENLQEISLGEKALPAITDRD